MSNDRSAIIWRDLIRAVTAQLHLNALPFWGPILRFRCDVNVSYPEWFPTRWPTNLWFCAHTPLGPPAVSATWSSSPLIPGTSAAQLWHVPFLASETHPPALGPSPKFWVPKKQDEAHEPECRHVRQKWLVTFSSEHTCGTPWLDTLRWHPGHSYLALV